MNFWADLEHLGNDLYNIYLLRTSYLESVLYFVFEFNNEMPIKKCEK